jgi:hypothetical protein
MVATLALARALAIQNPAYRPTDTLMFDFKSNAVEINAVSRLIKCLPPKANRSLTLISDIPLIVRLMIQATLRSLSNCLYRSAKSAFGPFGVLKHDRIATAYSGDVGRSVAGFAAG